MAKRNQTEKPPTHKTGAIDVLTVTTVRGVPTLRRAGRRFSREPISIDLAVLNVADIDALKNEPRLEVTQGQVDVIDAAGESNA